MWSLLIFKLSALLFLQMDLLLLVPEPGTSSWLTSLPCLAAPPAALGFPACTLRPSASYCSFPTRLLLSAKVVVFCSLYCYLGG